MIEGMNEGILEHKENKFITVLRWILFFPASMGVALIAGMVSGFLTTLWQQEGIFQDFVVHTTSGGVMGVMVVYVGTSIAPTHKKIVAYILGGFTIGYSGMALFGVLFQRDFWGIWQMFVLIVAVGCALYGIITNKKYVINGLGGNDTISGLNGDDIICGGAGNDTLTGNNDKDVLLGGAGND
jgi:Ca2+-binding RTX toxin-like protein